MEELKKLKQQIIEDYMIAKERLDKEEEDLQKQYTRQIEELKKLSNIIDKFKNKKLSKKNIKEIMSITCFKSLSFCCDKECIRRNIVLKLLKISKDKFYKAKKEFDRGLIKC